MIRVVPPAEGRALARRRRWRGARRICLTVHAERTPALRLYRSAGFAEIAAGLQRVLRRAYLPAA